MECEHLASPILKCPQLNALQLQTAEQLRAPTVLSASLTTLDLADCRQLSRPNLRCERLLELNLSSCTALSAEQIQQTLTHCPALRTLRLGGCRGLLSLPLASASLRVLHLGWSTGLQGFNLRCPALLTLYAFGCTALATPVVRSPRLTSLELQKCVGLHDDILPSLTRGAKALELLNLTDCKLLRSPHILGGRLRTLHLFNCVALASASIYCPALDFLNLTHCAELAHITLVCPRLTTLLCAGCKRLPDAQMRQAMNACRGLRTCDVKGCVLLSEQTVADLEQLCLGPAHETYGAVQQRAGGDEPEATLEGEGSEVEPEGAEAPRQAKGAGSA